MADRMAYRIPNWERFEQRNRERDGIKRPAWFVIENRLDGDFYLDLIALGAEALGVFWALLMVASLSNAQGLLTRDDGEPHTTETLSRKTRLPQPLLESVLEKLLAIRRIEQVPLIERAPNPAQQRVNGHAKPNGAEKPPPPPNVEFEKWWKRWCEATGLADGKPEALATWAKHVKPDDLAKVWACSELYWASQQVRNRAIKAPANFIAAQAKQGWAGTWPAAAEPGRKQTVAESVKTLARNRIDQGRRPM